MKKTLPDMNPNKESNESMDRILDASAKLKVPAKLSKAEAWAKLEEKIDAGISPKSLETKTKSFSIYKISLSAAASVILLLASWFLFVHKPEVEVIAQKGQQTHYILPDGSEIALNADSKIFYSAKSFKNKRKIEFQGEAFFKIQKGKSFVINTELADIQILGTSFNVYARKEDFNVSCVTGKIKVSSKESEIIIVAGEKVSFKNGTLVKEEIRDVQEVAAWRQGEFKFENSSLSQVFEEIERQYNVNFVHSNLEEKYFTGSFSNKNLVDALDIVCIPMGLTYEIGSNSNIIIHEKP